MAPSPQAGSDAGSGRGFEPEGSADVTPPFSESNSANSSPAYLKWAENLHNLLADPDGVELYKSYMKTENVGELLDFWFACEGLKRLPADQTEKIYQIIKVINKKFLRSKLVPIGEETRKAISEKISTKSGTDQTIFDNAQCEVEEKMTRTTYRNFLGSELYLNYIQTMQVGEHSDLSPKLSGSHSNESSISGRGAGGGGHGLGDDSGHFSAPLPDIEKSKSNQSLASTGRAVSSALSNMTSDSTSGISDTSGPSSGLGPNTSVVAPAAPNSSIITVNQSGADSSMMGSDEPSVLQYNMSHSTTLPTLHENSELELEVGAQCPSLPHSLMSSLTQANISLTARKRHNKPESQAGIYLQQGGGGRVPHPYHAYNSAYNPVSRQDSELQSLSSEAHTTDDNMSSFTESSSIYSNQYRLQHNKKYLRRQARRIQEQSRQNREQQFHPQANNFIPRTERIPAEASHQLSPTEFADILIKKLEKVKREQELDEKLNRKLAEDAQSMVSQGSNRSLADILREKLIVTEDLEGDQSILDDHVSRIWTDKTPLRSPGDPSGRPRSPGYSRSRPVASLPPRLSTSVTMGAMGPPPPRRGVQSAGRRTGGSVGGSGMYHQDLAYYDLGQTSHATPSGTGVNERVREWMLDVERQQSVETGHDQRSHSSKGNVKTSPRSNRMKSSGHSSGHRPVSQDRMMSTSWSGSGQMYPPPPPAAAKLGASLVMPPPSQSNTLRKPSASQDVTVAVYTFSHEKGEPMPYRIKIPAKNVTLRQVKDFLPKKGAFRFYFKTEVDGDMCYEEETEDGSLVPLWEGKILVQCRLLE